MSALRQAALALAARGFAILPLRPRTKEPYGPDKSYYTGNGCKDATRDSDHIKFWWARHPDNNIGVATGSVSSVFVLDADGDQGRETLATLEEQRGALPETVTVITPGKINKKTGVHTGKGLHLYFRYPLGRDIRNAQDHIDLHVRGNGGYVLAPPSAHPDGGVYTWSNDSADTLADAPEWLIDFALKGGSGGQAKSPEEYRGYFEQTFEGSRRASVIRSLYGHLVRNRIHLIVALCIVRDFNRLHCRPPLADAEIIDLAEFVAGREHERRGAHHDWHRRLVE
jgi:hypothetical protein